jgi:uncharacterized membrane protein
MIDFIIWYLMIFMLGWLCVPIAFRLFPSFTDRGFAFSRSLGLLLWGYIFWMLASLGVLRNDIGGLLFALVLVVLIAVWAMRNNHLAELLIWIRQNKRYVFFIEGLFFIAFAAWAAVRAANPEILGTEKPMELAFINAILHSPVFPPHDPWLSGYAISYYYFGYVIVAMLAKLANIPGAIAFNLGITTVFAVSAMGAYGIVYNLLAGETGNRIRSLMLPLFGPLCVLLVGNLEGFLEVLHARGIFWTRLTSGEWVSSFWKWLDLVELTKPPTQPLSWMPTRFYWWWRASRVVQDYDAVGNVKEIIDEFPAFSYLLADLHPHVLAMPFAFLAMAVALQVYRGARQSLSHPWRFSIPDRWLAWIGSLALAGGISEAWVGVAGVNLKEALFGVLGITLGAIMLSTLLPSIRSYGAGIFFASHGVVKTIRIPIFGDAITTFFCALVLGGLAFLNTWDFPFYLALTVASYSFGKWEYIQITPIDQSDRELPGGARFLNVVKDFIWTGLLLGVAGILLYLPFYVGFSSQAGGIIPNLIYPTRGTHLWIMFAPLLIPVLLYFIYLWRRNKSDLLKGLGIAGGIMLALWIFSLMYGWVILALPGIGDIYLGSLAAPNPMAVFQLALSRRLVNSGGWLTLLVLFGTTLAFLSSTLNPTFLSKIKEDAQDQTYILLVILLGVLLVLGPEFFYLRDQFGWRINTIFKFYYQAWLLWGIAAGYITGLLWQNWHHKWGSLYKTGMAFIFGIGLTYLVLGLITKTQGFNPQNGWNLDGSAYLQQQVPNEMTAFRWLANAPAGVVAEAVSPTGGSYTEYARVSMLSGQPGVLGWIGHESQWRGGGKEMGTRQADLERLYCTRQWSEAEEIIKRYNIQYVYVGSLERVTYVPGQGNCQTGLNEIKFLQYMDTVFKQGDVSIYALPSP